jgi:hypothetical protein
VGLCGWSGGDLVGGVCRLSVVLIGDYRISWSDGWWSAGLVLALEMLEE